MNKTTPKHDRLRYSHIIRLVIQIIFFAVLPSAFSSAFSAVKEASEVVSGGSPLSLTPFMKILLLLVIFTIVFGRVFCGYACAFGSLGDWIYGISQFLQNKSGRKLPRIPEKYISGLQYLKYAVLVAIMAVCFTGNSGLIGKHSPWTVFSLLISRRLPGKDMIIGTVLLIIIICGMAVRQRFFCQFLCPLGAIFSLMPILPSGRLRRDESSCIKGCTICSRNCPVSLKLGENEIREGECVMCGECLIRCPKANIKKKPLPIAALVLAGALFALTLTGCGQNSGTGSNNGGSGSEELTEETIELFAMDTYMTVTAYGDNAKEALDKVENEIVRIDSLLSTGDPGSEISALNSEKSLKVSYETFELIRRAKEIGEDTNGVFDVTIYPVMRAWGFTDGDYRVPDKQEISEIIRSVDYSAIELNEDELTVELKDDMEIDLGGIAKGYTSDRIRDIFKECGIEHALINLGGNVYVLGKKPDGSDWRVAIMDPTDQTKYAGGVIVSDKAVITSGGYQRFFEQNGETYIHIIDPSDGYPAANGLISATVVSDDGTLADALSTSLFIMGPDKAVEYWRNNADQFDAVLIRDDGTLLITEGLQDRFFTDENYEIISRN